MSSIYIHIPFCDTLCNYCDFCKVLNYKKFTKPYLEKLFEEFDNSYNGEVIETLYFGGGTPSALSVLEIQYLSNIIDKINFSNDYEFTFECNFENISEEKLGVLKDLGVNRLSFGVQTFNERLLKITNRNHNISDVRKYITYARQLGFSNISVDFIFNLPTQTLEEMKQDLKLFLSLDTDHISLYSLIVEEKSVFYHNNVVVDDNLSFEMYDYIRNQLINNSYIHYETSNFCKKGFESKHNLKYWNCEEYFGFGLGAHGYIDGVRYFNTSSITKYLKDNEREEEYLKTIDMMQEYMFLGLRKVEGISLKMFEEKFGCSMFEVFDIDKIDADLIIIDKDTFKLSEKGLFLANEVLIHFV